MPILRLLLMLALIPGFAERHPTDLGKGRATMSSRLDEKVNALQVLRRAELLARLKRAYRRPAPKRISRELLLLALAYRMQERAEGGLSRGALKRLNGIGSADGEKTPPPRPRVPRLQPGTRLVREWHGEVHQVR